MTVRKPWIIITSINHPTAAVQEFAALARARGWGMVVVGDTRSPPSWEVDGVEFLSIPRQNELFPEPSRSIRTGHYARKNLGYLFAIQAGASVIIESDDDNRPYSFFPESFDTQVRARRVTGGTWINSYRYFTNTLVWPRGLPLDQVHSLGSLSEQAESTCPIQQYLADLDPDVDAIYRLLFKRPLTFDADAAPLIVAKETFCPFNSQNTLFFPPAFDLLYLPSKVSFRMTDIWRGLVAQRVMWEQNHELSFHRATVFQERNEHNLMRDFEDENVGYLRNSEIGATLQGLDLRGLSPPEMVLTCYRALCAIGVVPDDEVDLVDLWLRELQRVAT